MMNQPEIFCSLCGNHKIITEFIKNQKKFKTCNRCREKHNMIVNKYRHKEMKTHDKELENYKPQKKYIFKTNGNASDIVKG